MISFRSFVVVLGLVLLGSGPAATAQAPNTSRSVERTPGARPTATSEEGGLWDVAARLEQDLKRSGVILRDPALNAYVRDMTCNLTGPHCQDLRVYLIEQPVWNAFMTPNGTMAVYSGLMLRMDNEAELACVVGHEAGHFIQNHSLENFRRTKSTANWAMALGMLAGAAGAPSGSGELISVAAIASILSYNRAQESEADRIGFNKIAAGGYDLGACAGVWRKLLAEFEASDQRRVRERATGQSGMFDSHPGAIDRIAALDALAKAGPAQNGSLNQQRYRAAIRPHLKNWLAADVRRKDYGSSLHFIERRIGEGQDLGTYHFFKGEALRRRNKDGDRALAKAAFAAAINFADAPAEAYRELGFLHLRDQAPKESAAMLRAYLEKAPEAEDRLLIEGDLRKLEQGAP
jgi:predicted Zn-dependent protease